MDGKHPKDETRAAGLSGAAEESAMAPLEGLTISADRMTATVDRIDGQTTLAAIETLFERHGVVHGVDCQAIRAALIKAQQGALLREVVVARGTSAQPARDAIFQWATEVEPNRPGKVRADGSIDFRERNLQDGVKEGALIGTLLPSQEGKAGIDVQGTPIPVLRPTSVEVIFDARIYTRKVDDRLEFFAGAGGRVSWQSEVKRTKQRIRRRLRLRISSVVTIDGDVDYATGNIDFPGDVVIHGSVRPLFSVKASGEVLVKGYVEAGALISTGGDLTVGQGVVGSATELIAGGTVLVKFIQEATVRAGGNVQVGVYLFNASVRAVGRVLVMGRGEGKHRALVGGLIWAGKGIEAASIGSLYSSSTRLVVGVDPERVIRLEQVRANIVAGEQRQRELMKGIGIDSLDMELIRQQLQRKTAPAQRKSMAAGLKQLVRLAGLQENLRQELSQLAEEQHHLARHAEIVVRYRLFAGVEVRLGEHILQVPKDGERVRLRLVEDEGRSRIELRPLSVRRAASR